MEPRIYPFRIGAIDCLAVSDKAGPTMRSVDLLRPEIPAASVEQALRELQLDPRAIPVEYTSLYLKTAGRQVLVDTGLGPDGAPDGGRLLEHLRGAGVQANDIDTVVISHAHGDHINGTLTAEGGLAFPRARYVVGRREWELSATREPVRRHFAAFGDRLQLVDEGDEIAPGMHVVAAPGHTPGQIAVAISSRGERLLFVADLLHMLIQMGHPEWCTIWDADPERAAASRRRLLGPAAAEGVLVMGSHLPWPSVGRLAARGEGWRWEAVGAAL